MKHVLVTGGKGQLGRNLQKIANHYGSYHLTFVDVDELDLTQAGETWDYFSKHHPDYIINCAAYTAVDKAEEQPEMAFRINGGIPQLLGEIVQNNGIRLLHISTDYVYDGTRSVPHLEEENPAPVSIYARSKLQGEKALQGNESAIVIRTAWLFSEYGPNFMTNMLRIGTERKKLGVVFDQSGTPTYAGDLADTLMRIISFSDRETFLHGTYNFSNEGVCSWFDFALEVMRLGGKDCRVYPIRTREYPLPARRPEYGVMDKAKIKRTFGIEIPYWRDSLITALDNLKKNEEI